MIKRKNINVKSRISLRGCNMNPRVLITRLTSEDLARYVSTNQNKYKHSLPCPNETYIKQEPVDENEVTEIRQYEYTYQEIQSTVKIEPVDLSIVKPEPVDTYENTSINSTFTNFYGTFKCKICYQVFNDYEEFIVHKNLDHDIQQYACPYCDQKFCLRAHLNSHLIVHAEQQHMKNTPLAISSVTASSSKSDSLTVNEKRKYIRKVTNIVPQYTTQLKHLKCLNCNFITDSKTKFSCHKSICIKNKVSSSNTNNNSFSCDLCLNSYINQTSLNGHMRYHSLRGDMISKRALRRKGVYIQPLKKPKPKSKLKEKEKLFCKVCDKQFVFYKRLERHMQLHKSVRTIKNKQDDNGTLKTRKNVPKPVKFTVKFEILNTKNNGKNHQKQLKPFQCPHCENYYSSKRSLSDHTKQFHDFTNLPLLKQNKSPSVKCNYCNVSITKCNLKRHIKNLHSDVE